MLVSAQMAGDGPTAVEAAGKLDRVMSDAIAREVGWVQVIKTAPYFAHAQFTDPDTILALPAPAGSSPSSAALALRAGGRPGGTRGFGRGPAEEKALADLAATGDFPC